MANAIVALKSQTVTPHNKMTTNSAPDEGRKLVEFMSPRKVACFARYCCLCCCSSFYFIFLIFPLIEVPAQVVGQRK